MNANAIASREFDGVKVKVHSNKPKGNIRGHTQRINTLNQGANAHKGKILVPRQPNKWYCVQMKTHLHQLMPMDNTAHSQCHSHLLPLIHLSYPCVALNIEFDLDRAGQCTSQEMPHSSIVDTVEEEHSQFHITIIQNRELRQHL